MKGINKSYCKPEIEIVNLDSCDIIVTSSWKDGWDMTLEELEDLENQGG